MINKHDTIYRCVITGHHTTVLHEIFFGIANRKTSVKYSLQVPVCEQAHKIAHGLNVVNLTDENLLYMKELTQRQIKHLFCQKIGIDFHAANFGVNLLNKSVLKNMQEIAEKNLKRYEVN